MSAAPKDVEFRNGMPFFGGRLWLDLLNTTPFLGGEQHDFLATREGLAAWLAAAEIEATPENGDALRSFRELLRSTIDLIRIGGPLPADVMAAVNDKLAEVRIHLRLAQGATGPSLETRLDPGAAGAAGIVARDFAHFICDREPERLKRCSNPACTMVFYDLGKNNTRRWCTMSICGNRDKVARYRARQAETRAT